MVDTGAVSNSASKRPICWLSAPAGRKVDLVNDDRIRVFVSSSMSELAPERAAVDRALKTLGIAAWLLEDDAGARPTTIQQT
jgi:hypothetical protein